MPDGKPSGLSSKALWALLEPRRGFAKSARRFSVGRFRPPATAGISLRRCFPGRRRPTTGRRPREGEFQSAPIGNRPPWALCAGRRPAPTPPPVGEGRPVAAGGRGRRRSRRGWGEGPAPLLPATCDLGTAARGGVRALRPCSLRPCDLGTGGGGGVRSAEIATRAVGRGPFEKPQRAP